jgi:hypothetical protein
MVRARGKLTVFESQSAQLEKRNYNIKVVILSIY